MTRTRTARRDAARRVAAALAAPLAMLRAGGASAATVLIEIARTSPDEAAPTFGGRGRPTVSGAAAPRTIDALSLTIATSGTRGEAREPVTHRFEHGPSDLVAVSGLHPRPFPPIRAGLSLGPEASRDGAVTIWPRASGSPRSTSAARRGASAA